MRLVAALSMKFEAAIGPTSVRTRMSIEWLVAAEAKSAIAFLPLTFNVPIAHMFLVLFVSLAGCGGWACWFSKGVPVVGWSVAGLVDSVWFVVMGGAAAGGGA